MSKTKRFLDFMKEGDGGGGGFGGTVATVGSDGGGLFDPTYSGNGKKKKEEDDGKSPKSFAKDLVVWVKSNQSLLHNTFAPRSSPKGLQGEPDPHEAMASYKKYKDHDVVKKPEEPFKYDPVSQESLMQKMENDDDVNLSTKMVVFDFSNRVLILKDAYSDYWDLPGGHIRDGESVDEGVQREVDEEVGLWITHSEQIFVKELMLDTPRVVVFYAAKLREAEPKIDLSEEHLDYEWIEESQIEEYNLGVFEPILRYVMTFSFDNLKLDDMDRDDETLLKGTAQNLVKDKVYLKPGEQPPKGIPTKQGPHGGHYYETGPSSSTTQELGRTPQNKPQDAIAKPKIKPGFEGRFTNIHNEIETDFADLGVETTYDDENIEEFQNQFKYTFGVTPKEIRHNQVDKGQDAFGNPLTPALRDYSDKWEVDSLADGLEPLYAAVAEMYGDDPERASKPYTDKMKTNPYIDYKAPKQEEVDAVRSSLEYQYETTQEELAKKGITHLTLYRGVNGKSSKFTPGEVINMKDNMLSSWTMHPQTAAQFGNVMVSKTFDVRDIVMSSLDVVDPVEAEFVVHVPESGNEVTVEALDNDYV